MSSSAPSSKRPTPSAKRERKLTGRGVLICLICFFGTIATVNTTMIRAALSTHGGAEKISSYRAGLNFTKDRDKADEQKRLQWQVNIALPHAPEHDNKQGCSKEVHGCLSQGLVEANVKDINGQPVPGLDATLIFIHPTDSRRDQSFKMSDSGNGAYRAVIDVANGRWSIDLDLDYQGKQMFRSSSRVVLN